MSNTIYRFEPLPNEGIHPIYNTTGEVPEGYELFMTIPKPVSDYVVNGETIPVCYVSINAVAHNKMEWSRSYTNLRNKIRKLHESKTPIEIEGVQNIQLFKILISALTIPDDLKTLSEMHYHDEYPLHIRRSSTVVYMSYVKYVASSFDTLLRLENANDDLSKE